MQHGISLFMGLVLGCIGAIHGFVGLARLFSGIFRFLLGFLNMPLQGFHHTDDGPVDANSGMPVIYIEITLHNPLRRHQQIGRILAQLAAGFARDDNGCDTRPARPSTAQASPYRKKFWLRAS